MPFSYFFELIACNGGSSEEYHQGIAVICIEKDSPHKPRLQAISSPLSEIRTWPKKKKKEFCPKKK